MSAPLRKRIPLSVAYTPDSDDAFNYFAWEHGRLRDGGFEPTFSRDHIVALNRAAFAGEYDVVGVSSAVYPLLADQYRILAVGNSVGRGYGPVLVSRGDRSIDDLRGSRIGVGGHPTTGSVLAAMFCEDAQLVEMRYDTIADAVASGELDAGVMIHEELLFFPEKGLTKVADLGKVWWQMTGLPLPVGLNLVHRRHDLPAARRIARLCRDSLMHAHEHFDEAFAFASTFGRGCARDHVAMFSNDDTRRLPGDVREAIGLMCRRVAEMNLGPRLEEVEVVDAE